jgi:hypothetical protein
VIASRPPGPRGPALCHLLSHRPLHVVLKGKTHDRADGHNDHSGAARTASQPTSRSVHNGGSARGYQELSRRWLQGRPGYSPAGRATRVVYLYIAALIASVLIRRVAWTLGSLRLAGDWMRRLAARETYAVMARADLTAVPALLV